MSGFFETQLTTETTEDMPDKAHDHDFVAKHLLAIRSVLKNIEGDLDKAVGLLAAARGKVIVTGIGKSGHIGMKIASTMNSLGSMSVFLHPAEAFHGDLGLVAKGDVVVMLSHSGETKETLRLLQHLKRQETSVVAITGNGASMMAAACDAVLTYDIEDEGSPHNLAPMASTSAMLVIGDLLAARVCRARGFTARDFAVSHPGGSLGLQLTHVSEVMRTGDALPLVSHDATFVEALREMNAKKLGVLGVTGQDGRLMGVLSDGDVRRFVSSEHFSLAAPIALAMTPDPKVIAVADSLQAALALMERHKITVLFALDETGGPQGVIHMHHIIEGRIV